MSASFPDGVLPLVLFVVIGVALFIWSYNLHTSYTDGRWMITLDLGLSALAGGVASIFLPFGESVVIALAAIICIPLAILQVMIFILLPWAIMQMLGL